MNSSSIKSRESQFASRRRRGEGWQAEKSEITRNHILEAAIRCFVRLGYARTTTTEIGREAAVSRGAMVHHFPHKEELVKAAIDYLNQKRIDTFGDAISALSQSADHTGSGAGIEVYWETLTNNDFIAFHELTVAARTNPELEAILIPAVRSFEREWYNQVQKLFPEWEGTGELFDLAMDFTQFLMEGMALHTMIDPDEDRYRRVRRYLVIRLQELLEAARKPDTAKVIDKYLSR